jgi:hypothetical protein
MEIKKEEKHERDRKRKGKLRNIQEREKHHSKR